MVVIQSERSTTELQPISVGVHSMRGWPCHSRLDGLLAGNPVDEPKVSSRGLVRNRTSRPLRWMLASRNEFYHAAI